MKIHFSNYDQLLNECGLVLELKYVPQILGNTELANLFYEKMKGFTNSKETHRQELETIKDFFREHFKDIDQEAYVFFTLKSIREERLEERCPRILERCKLYLEDSQFVHYEPRITHNSRDIEIKRITPSILIGKKENIDNSKIDERWRRIREVINPEDLFDVNSAIEMTDFYCSNDFLDVYIKKLNFIRVIEKFKTLSAEDKLDFMTGQRYEEFTELTREAYEKLDPESEEDMRLLIGAIPEYMQKFPESFDLDTMLLIAAFKANDHLENHMLTEEQNRKYALILKTCMDSVKSKSKKVVGIKDSLGTKSEVPYTYKSLQEACQRISRKGHYVSNLERDLIESSIYENPLNLLDKDPDIIDVLHLSKEDLQYLLTAEGTIGYLLENKFVPKTIVKQYLGEGKITQKDLVDLLNRGLITDEEAKKYIGHISAIDNSTFEVFNERGILTSADKLSLFIDGKIEYEHIDSLSDDEKKQIADMLETSKLVELYKNQKDETTSQQYIRYAQIFRNLVLKNKSKDERINIDEQIIEGFGEKIEDEILEDLYNSHLITFESLKDWSGPKVISEMMEKTEIRPEDIKLMCSNGEFEVLFEVLKNPNISRNVKMGIFRTSFANMEYQEMNEEQRNSILQVRNICLKLINFVSEKSHKEKDEDAYIVPKPTPVPQPRNNSYTSDPQLRWDLIDLMGSYSYEMLDQGLAIFKFPEYKGGTIVLEKMYRKDKPEYGRATKIISMTPEEFEKIKPELIVNGDIPPFMVDSHPLVQERLTNLTHSVAWGQQFADYFGYNIEGERTQEEIARIDKKIQSILNSRELRQ